MNTIAVRKIVEFQLGRANEKKKRENECETCICIIPRNWIQYNRKRMPSRQRQHSTFNCKTKKKKILFEIRTSTSSQIYNNKKSRDEKENKNVDRITHNWQTYVFLWSHHKIIMCLCLLLNPFTLISTLFTSVQIVSNKIESVEQSSSEGETLWLNENEMNENEEMKKYLIVNPFQRLFSVLFSYQKKKTKINKFIARSRQFSVFCNRKQEKGWEKSGYDVCGEIDKCQEKIKSFDSSLHSKILKTNAVDGLWKFETFLSSMG